MTVRRCRRIFGIHGDDEASAGCTVPALLAQLSQFVGPSCPRDKPARKRKLERLSLASVAHLVAAESDGFTPSIWGNLYSQETEQFISNIFASTENPELCATVENSLLSALYVWGYDVRRTKAVVVCSTGIFTNPLFQFDPPLLPLLRHKQQS